MNEKHGKNKTESEKTDSLSLCMPLHERVLNKVNIRVWYSIESISFDKPDRDAIKLDDYLIPIMGVRE